MSTALDWATPAASLCTVHHREQNQIGELSFEKKYKIDLRELAIEFARRSPHRGKLSI